MIFEIFKNKNKLGTLNELLIAGNLAKKGFKVKVLNDKNPNYDIEIIKDDKVNYVECKLDLLSNYTGNFYFEYWNFTYNRPTGINNSDLETIYCHTYINNGLLYALIAKRKYFIDAIKSISNIRLYNNTYYVNGLIKGDKAYIIDKNTFLLNFRGYNIKLLLSFRW